MQLAQKISISIDPSLLGFIDHYVADHAARGRSAVVVKALQLLQRTEQESLLAQAYAQSANQDKLMATEFDMSLNDGLMVHASQSDSEKESDEAW